MEIECAVGIFEEDDLPAIPALGDMIPAVGNNDACELSSVLSQIIIYN